jgi:hypothetical protein
MMGQQGPAAAVKPEPRDNLLASLAQLGVQLELELVDSSSDDGEEGEQSDAQQLQKLINGLGPLPPLKLEQARGGGAGGGLPGPAPAPAPAQLIDWRSAALLRPLHIAVKPEPGQLLLSPPASTAGPWLLQRQHPQQQAGLGPALPAAGGQASVQAGGPGPLYIPAGPFGATIKLEVVQGGSGSSSSSGSSSGSSGRDTGASA